MRTLRPTTAIALFLALAASPTSARAQEPEQGAGGGARGSVQMVLDSSGSMQKADASGQTRIEAAREALQTLIGELPDGSPVGLRVYGDAQTKQAKKESCDQTTLVQPVEPLDSAELSGKVDDFDPGGSTPIGLALKDASKDLPDGGEQVIVLVSDGLDTCAPPDPCKVAADLARKGFELRIQAIGLNVDSRARRELRCIADATGGVYRDASDAASLADSLRAAVLRALRGYETAGDPVTGGETAETAAPITEGQYIDSIRPDEVRWYSLEVPEGTGYAASATLVPPLPRIPIGAASIAGRFSTGLFVDAAATPGAEEALDPDEPGERIDVEQDVELARDLAAGQPVSQLVTTEDVSDSEGRILFAVSLENFADPLPGRDYPLELLIDQVGTPVVKEEAPPPPESESDEENSDDGPCVVASIAVGGGGILAGLVIGSIAALRRRRT